MSIEQQARTELARSQSDRTQLPSEDGDSRKSKRELASESNPFALKMANRILEKIQLLDYHKSAPKALER